MQVISSLKVLKYLFKYIHKGGDRAAVPEGGPQPQPNANAGGGGNGGGANDGGANGANGGNSGNDAPAANGADGNGAEQPPEINEIQRYQDLRYFGSCEAAWRLYGFSIHSQHPATMKRR